MMHEGKVILNSARLEMKNLVSEAILGSNENSFVKRWGGELKIVGNTFTMNKRRGSDKSVFTFMYGRDIAGIDGYIDYAVTLGIDPRGYNNLRLDNNNKSKSYNVFYEYASEKLL